jgi:Mlc titration factor MtfA (ptsG expression regulator)
MANEKGGTDGWKIERCYMKGTEKEMIDLICGDFFICYAPVESEKFLSLPDDLARKYKDMFKYPERFFQTENGIKAVPFKPIQRDNER